MIHHRRLKRAGLAITAVSCLAGGAVVLSSAPELKESRPIRKATLMDSLESVDAFAWVWITVGVLCVVAVFWRRAHRAAFGFASALHVFWGLSYLAGWLLLDVPRGWVTACVYLIIAALVVVVAGIREELVPWVQPSRRR
ncbi:hypothetical protein ACH47B_06490 [Rhodococcus sp. NPDC019627]|uniref:hypothetical protein n=1 Tax=unclassified Rhodococcus (in: high G+C Gram-positive bacteria) TaxID=192944 RepID=UPI0037B2AA9E